MIVWINGAFGVGKTSTAKAVLRQAGWRMFDPEHVGFLLAGNLKDLDFEDFQDLPPWRVLVPVVADEIFRYTNAAVMVAVQTVLVEKYWAELKHGLADHSLPVLHVVLDCDEAELRRRIANDEVESQALEWRLEHLASYREARPWLLQSADLVLDTTELSQEAAANAIVEVVKCNDTG